ncbi:MAG TPA: nicotinamide-nucleotide adenylyltransferase [Nitrososphaeraceae archaeon]|nr:nicotinamide-nucleotide adenylyltransferase [Nitrososphaeraceae archaeon]
MEGGSEFVDNATRGLMIGRYQPFHLGHLGLAEQILSECEELVVAIGSPDANFSFTDPFTAGERITMVHESLKQRGLRMSNCYILPVPNSNNNYTWFQSVRSMLPRVTLIYTGNQFVQLLLPKDVKVRSPTFVKYKSFNGTRIRNLIVRNGNWQNLVPSPVALLIREIDGVSRLKKLKETRTEQERVLASSGLRKAI